MKMLYMAKNAAAIARLSTDQAQTIHNVVCIKTTIKRPPDDGDAKSIKASDKAYEDAIAEAKKAGWHDTPTAAGEAAPKPEPSDDADGVDQDRIDELECIETRFKYLEGIYLDEESDDVADTLEAALKQIDEELIELRGLSSDAADDSAKTMKDLAAANKKLTAAEAQIAALQKQIDEAAKDEPPKDKLKD